ncbi:MAG: hypothetical protein U9Q79_04145 [Candidatus Hydrogenedentes bacterium]|nr:hypothetical protein [Candidatus Hydrogenedentota bacterium]
MNVDGEPARCVEQTLFVNGDLRYLCLEQDILLRSLEAQKLTISIDTPAYVYDVRKKQAVAQEPVREWNVTISRGYPLLYALMPYPVTGVSAAVDSTCARGDTLKVATTVKAEAAQPQYHVVRVDVFAPGSNTPHRQYSQNIDCPKGQGSGTIPFALNDPAGDWRLVFRDVASGAKTEATMKLIER